MREWYSAARHKNWFGAYRCIGQRMDRRAAGCAAEACLKGGHSQTRGNGLHLRALYIFTVVSIRRGCRTSRSVLTNGGESTRHRLLPYGRAGTRPYGSPIPSAPNPASPSPRPRRSLCPQPKSDGGRRTSYMIHGLYNAIYTRFRTPRIEQCVFSGAARKTGEWRGGVGANDIRTRSSTPLSAVHTPRRHRFVHAGAIHVASHGTVRV